MGLPDMLVEDCIQKIKDEAVKDRLKQYTQQALDHGVNFICRP